MGGDHLWEAVGAIGEAVGALGVIGTIGYLALQIRQNSRMIRANIRQARSDSAVELHALGATSEIAEIQAKEQRGQTLTNVDERRLFLWYISVWRAQQTIFLQANDGLLDDELTSSEQAHVVRTIMALQSSQRWWADQKAALDSRFTSWVERQIEQSSDDL